MTNPYRAMCAELAEEVEHLWSIVRDDNNESHSLADRARALLAQPVAQPPADEDVVASLIELRSTVMGLGQMGMHVAAKRVERAADLLERQHPQPVAEESKPVVDYSRVPEIATDAQIRSAAQYLVKKRNCDGDLIPAIEYAIARWGHPTPQPPAELAEMVERLHEINNPTPQPVAVSKRLPRPEDCDAEGRCWFWERDCSYNGRKWALEDRTYSLNRPDPILTHWLPFNALPHPEATNAQ